MSEQNNNHSGFNLRFFFKGKLGREEAATALLASLLEQNAEFREKYFSLLKPCDIAAPHVLAQRNYKVFVEEEQVDLKMYDHENKVVFLIENKVQGSSKKPGQIERYYKSQIAKTPEYRTVFIYLTPDAASGTYNLEKIEFRETDYGYSIGWQDVISCIHAIPATDTTFGLCKESACEEIGRLIKDKEVKYPCEGDRALLKSMAEAVQNQLRVEYPEVGFKVWSGETKYDLAVMTMKSNITVYGNLLFNTEDEKPFRPRIRTPDGRLELESIKCSFRLSGMGKKSAKAKDCWNNVMLSKSIELSPGFVFVRDDNNFYCKSEKFMGSEDQVITTLHRVMFEVLCYFRSVLVG